MPVREIRVSYGEPLVGQAENGLVNIRTARAAAAVMRPLLEPEACEVGYVLCLTTKMNLIGYHQMSRGALDATTMHPREVFKAAVLANAASIVLVHNHPSGDPSPSPDDLVLTARLKNGGQLLGIELLDHIIIGHNGLYVSLKEQGRL